jgi:SNF2 family DNA or RNA helicase
LYNVGYEVPSPILHDGYDWAGQTLYLSQELTAGLMAMHHRAYVLNGLGTGKTLSTLLAVDYLIQQSMISRVLVVAPKSILQPVWEKEIYQRMPRLKPVVLSGTRKQRLKGLYSPGWNIAIINVEGVKVIANELHSIGFTAMVLDELALYRDRRTERWRIINKLVDTMAYCWGLTGAPIPNGPWDAYGQIRMLTPWQVPMSFYVFQQKVALPGAFPGQWIPRKGSQQIVFDLMQPAIRYTRAQVIELPPSQTITHEVKLSAPQRDAAKVLIKDLIVQYREGKVKAANAAVLLGKLLQIYSGAVYTDTRQVIDLQADYRIDLTRELITEAEGKAIVFVPYIHLCELLPQALGLPGIRVVHGSTPDRERNVIFTDFQDKNSPIKCLVAHPKCMAHGLNLTQANIIIWYAPTTSHETFDQANARIARAGQEREQIIYRLTSSAAENKIYKTLDNRGSMQEAVLDLFEQKFT